MRCVLRHSAVCLCLWCLSVYAAAEDYYSRFLSHIGTNDNGVVHTTLWYDRGEEVPALVDTNNTVPRLTKSKLSELTLRPQVALAGIQLGMNIDQVIAAWGKPRGVGLYGHGAPRLTYEDALFPDEPYAIVDVLFHPGSNSVMTIWVRFWNTYGRPFLSPNVDECLRVLGEPVVRDYIPNRVEPRKTPPRHWYCRMVYKQPPLVLYFVNGQLMALELNPQARGVAREGEGSDEYSVRFCLVE